MAVMFADQQQSYPAPDSADDFEDLTAPQLALSLEFQEHSPFWIALETPGLSDTEFTEVSDRIMNTDAATLEDKVNCLKKIAEASFPNDPEHQALGMVWLQAGWEKLGILQQSDRAALAYAIAFQEYGSDSVAVEDRVQYELARSGDPISLTLYEQESLAAAAAQKRFPYHPELRNLFYENCFGRLSEEERHHFKIEAQFHFADLPTSLRSLS